MLASVETSVAERRHHREKIISPLINSQMMDYYNHCHERCLNHWQDVTWTQHDGQQQKEETKILNFKQSDTKWWLNVDQSFCQTDCNTLYVLLLLSYTCSSILYFDLDILLIYCIISHLLSVDTQSFLLCVQLVCERVPAAVGPFQLIRSFGRPSVGL